MNTYTCAQNFSYTSTHSTAAYSDLSGATVLMTGQELSEKETVIPVGFKFYVQGIAYDSLRIQPQGYVFFGNKNEHFFSALHQSLVSLNASSSVASKLSGTQGSRIMKLEYKNCGIAAYEGHINYQVWLYEGSNKIELRMGDNTYSSLDENELQPMLGVLSNTGGATTALLTHGDPLNPQSSTINEGDDLLYLTKIPATGTLYSFMPN